MSTCLLFFGVKNQTTAGTHEQGKLDKHNHNRLSNIDESIKLSDWMKEGIDDSSTQKLTVVNGKGGKETNIAQVI